MKAAITAFSLLLMSSMVFAGGKRVSHRAVGPKLGVPVIGAQYLYGHGGDFDLVTVMGYEPNAGYVIRYEDGNMAGKGTTIDSDDAHAWLASLSGCAQRTYCVGNQYVWDSVDHKDDVTIAGVLPGGRVIVLIQSGKWTGHRTDVETYHLLSTKFRDLLVDQGS